jgi:hypothetical protein
MVFALFTSCLFSVPTALGHAPLISGDNMRLTEAMFIPDPTKSWAIYGELHESRNVDYYRFEIQKGQRIYISLMKPTNPETREFKPGFVLMGPGLINQGNIPEYMEQPSGSNIIVVMGNQPAQATYEPFAPSSFYQLGQLGIPAPDSGTYYVAVHEPERGGHYSLAIGERESFSLTEWILIPISLISVYQWEGQSLFMIFLPIIVTSAIGLLLLWNKNWMPNTPFEWGGILAGILFLCTGSTVIFQMALALSHTPIVQEAFITFIFALLPMILGIAVIRSITNNRENVDIRKRAYLAAMGIIALFVWAGFLVGPMLALLTSVIPGRKTEKPGEQKII